MHFTNKQKVSFGIITGTILIIVLIVITITNDGCQYENTSFIFRAIMALAGAAFAMSITGTIQLQNNIIKAGGPIAIFVIIYFFQPTQIGDFKKCQKNIKGIIYYGTDRVANVYVEIEGLNIIPDLTNNSGMFNLENINLPRKKKNITLILKKASLNLDRYYNINMDSLENVIVIKLPKKCIELTELYDNKTLFKEYEKCGFSEKNILSKQDKNFIYNPQAKKYIAYIGPSPNSITNNNDSSKTPCELIKLRSEENGIFNVACDTLTEDGFYWKVINTKRIRPYGAYGLNGAISDVVKCNKDNIDVIAETYSWKEGTWYPIKKHYSRLLPHGIYDPNKEGPVAGVPEDTKNNIFVGVYKTVCTEYND